MEPRIDLQADLEPYRPVYAEGPHAYFAKAWAFTNAFYKRELQVIASRRFETVTPGMVFHEHMWVVHATGFNARVVGVMMPKLQAAYRDFRDVAQLDFEFLYKQENLSTPELLQKLPFIGPVTCYPLLRCVAWMQVEFRRKTNQSVLLGIVDLCVWYLASTFGTKELKKEGER